MKETTKKNIPQGAAKWGSEGPSRLPFSNNSQVGHNADKQLFSQKLQTSWMLNALV